MQIQTQGTRIYNQTLRARPALGGPAADLRYPPTDGASISSEARTPNQKSPLVDGLLAAFNPGPSKEERARQLRQEIRTLEFRLQWLEAEAKRPKAPVHNISGLPSIEQRIADTKRRLGELKGKLALLELKSSGGLPPREGPERDIPATGGTPRRRVKRRRVRRRRVPASGQATPSPR